MQGGGHVGFPIINHLNGNVWICTDSSKLRYTSFVLRLQNHTFRTHDLREKAMVMVFKKQQMCDSNIF